MVWPNPIINGVLNDDKYLKILRYTHCAIGKIYLSIIVLPSPNRYEKMRVLTG